MFKQVLICGAVLGIVGSAFAQYNRCSYTPLQDAIRTARNEQQIQDLISKGVRLDEQARCGGSLLQLAIVRGNPGIVNLMLKQNPELAKTPVRLDYFPIQGAPAEVPVLMFAARYAVRPEIITGLINAGAAATELDKNGENVLWYINKNPVLVETDLSDKLRDMLLYQPKPVATSTVAAVNQAAPAPSVSPSSPIAPLGSPVVPARAQPLELVEKAMPVKL